MTDTVAEVAALTGCAITRLVVGMVRKSEFRLGSHLEMKCQKDREQSLENAVLNKDEDCHSPFSKAHKSDPFRKVTSPLPPLLPPPLSSKDIIWVTRRSTSPTGS